MIKLRKNLFLLLLAIAYSAVSVADEGSATSNEAERILIIGDSLSAAYNMRTKEAWPNLLQLRLEEDGYAWRVFNSSITGDTTESALARLPRLIERHTPGVVIIELGGNDGLRGLPLQVTINNMAAMIEMSREQGAQVLLAGIRIPPNYGAQYVSQFEAMYPELAAQYETELVPFFMEGVALDPNLMQSDGIHPAVEAQPVLLDNIWPTLKAMIDRQEHGPAND